MNLFLDKKIFHPSLPEGKVVVTNKLLNLVLCHLFLNVTMSYPREIVISKIFSNVEGGSTASATEHTKTKRT